MASEAEWEAVRRLAETIPVAWAWFKKVLREQQRLMQANAIAFDGDKSTRAKGATLLAEMLLQLMQEAEKSFYQAEHGQEDVAVAYADEEED